MGLYKTNRRTKRTLGQKAAIERYGVSLNGKKGGNEKLWGSIKPIAEPREP